MPGHMPLVGIRRSLAFFHATVSGTRYCTQSYCIFGCGVSHSQPSQALWIIHLGT